MEDQSRMDEGTNRIPGYLTIREVVTKKLHEFTLLCVYLHVHERSNHIRNKKMENKKYVSPFNSDDEMPKRGTGHKSKLDSSRVSFIYLQCYLIEFQIVQDFDENIC